MEGVPALLLDTTTASRCPWVRTEYCGCNLLGERHDWRGHDNEVKGKCDWHARRADNSITRCRRRWYARLLLKIVQSRATNNCMDCAEEEFPDDNAIAYLALPIARNIIPSRSRSSFVQTPASTCLPNLHCLMRLPTMNQTTCSLNDRPHSHEPSVLSTRVPNVSYLSRTFKIIGIIWHRRERGSSAVEHRLTETPPPPTLTSMSSPKNQSLADSTLEGKYPEGLFHEELGSNARVWRVNLDMYEVYDNGMVIEARDRLDLLRVFFSPHLSLSAQTSQGLSNNISAVSTPLLLEMLTLQPSVSG